MVSTEPLRQVPLPIMLANTISVDRGRVRDSLAEGADLEQWVRKIGEQMNLSPRPSGIEAVTSPAAERLIALRDGIRRLAAEHTQDPRTLGQSLVPDVAAAMTIINSTSALSSVWPELEWDDSAVRRRDVWAGGEYVDAVTAVLARQTVELSASAQWDRLRPCLAPGCAYFFVKDHVRRQWCAPHCGNRERSHVTRSVIMTNEGAGLQDRDVRLLTQVPGNGVAKQQVVPISSSANMPSLVRRAISAWTVSLESTSTPG